MWKGDGISFHEYKTQGVIWFGFFAYATMRIIGEGMIPIHDFVCVLYLIERRRFFPKRKGKERGNLRETAEKGTINIPWAFSVKFFESNGGFFPLRHARKIPTVSNLMHARVHCWCFTHYIILGI